MTLLRTFLAFEIPEEAKREIGSAQKRLAGPGLRMVDPENLHLTLKFIGDWEESRLAELCDAAGRAAAGVQAFDFTLKGIGAFPNLSRPHVLFLGCSDSPAGSFARIHRAIEAELEPLGVRPEGRAFKPHLTLARVKSGKVQTGLRESIGSFEGREFGCGFADELLVVLSDLTREGPVYTRAGTLPLAAPVQGHEP